MSDRGSAFRPGAVSVGKVSVMGSTRECGHAAGFDLELRLDRPHGSAIACGKVSHPGVILVIEAPEVGRRWSISSYPC